MERHVTPTPANECRRVKRPNTGTKLQGPRHPIHRGRGCQGAANPIVKSFGFQPMPCLYRGCRQPHLFQQRGVCYAERHSVIWVRLLPTIPHTLRQLVKKSVGHVPGRPFLDVDDSRLAKGMNPFQPQGDFHARLERIYRKMGCPSFLFVGRQIVKVRNDQHEFHYGYKRG